MPDRDRDASGRARNARPRDGLGRPLPRGSVEAFEPVPDELHLSVDDTITLAQTYLDKGRPFHAHEVFETLWKTREPAERDLWQGLAQIAVGITHALRGNAAGGARLLRRGAGRVGGYSGATYGVNVNAVVTFADGLANELADNSAASASPTTLHLRAAR